MTTVRIPFDVNSFTPDTAAGAKRKCVAGTNFPVYSLAFIKTSNTSAYVVFKASSYGSGNLTLNIIWRADTASSGDVIFGAAIAAITPDTDSGDVETKAFATANTVTDTCLGAGRAMACAITISNLDSIAANDYVALKIHRDAVAGGDTMTGEAEILNVVELTYSDT